MDCIDSIVNLDLKILEIKNLELNLNGAMPFSIPN